MQKKKWKSLSSEVIKATADFGRVISGHHHQHHPYFTDIHIVICTHTLKRSPHTSAQLLSDNNGYNKKIKKQNALTR